MKILLTLPILALLGVVVAELQVTSKTKLCTNGHCIECDNGNCKEIGVKKREADQHFAKVKNCVVQDGQKICTVCSRGRCHPMRKREAEGATCDGSGCVICDEYDKCEYYSNGTWKREAKDNSTIIVKDCVRDSAGYQSCLICSNGKCNTMVERKKRGVMERRKREFGFGRERQFTSRNCVKGNCIACRHGRCFDEPNLRAKRSDNQTESYSKNCTNGNCTECVNGSCRSFHDI